jgi:signal transduction histidine kinase
LKHEAPLRARVDINQVIEEITGLAEVELEGIVVQLNLAEDLPPVLADRVQLQQVLLNLIMNAIDAMKPVTDRARLLRISTVAQAAEGVGVTVADSGVGLDTRTMDQLFDAFYTTKAGGLGLGLSISRSVIEAHGGKLWAEPNDGPGAVFRFTLPAGKDDVP